MGNDSVAAGRRCSNQYAPHYCRREASVLLFAPSDSRVPGAAGRRVPGSWCRPCAERAVAEYAEKLGERWAVRDADSVCGRATGDGAAEQPEAGPSPQRSPHFAYRSIGGS